MTSKDGQGKGGTFFRRYRRLKDGTVLDAHDYGYKAWPFRPKR
ncbi:MAG TPA: hypothetical protein VEF76_02035 [Patescibacteria group bacterium]|nr:hypothetical protein [Patescibacteria group bacterium]